MKKVIAIIISLMMILAISLPAAAITAKPAAKKTVIKVWSSTRHDQVYNNSMIKKYNETNKDGIQVKYTVYSDNYGQILNLASSSNSLPDLFYDATGVSPGLVVKNKIAFLDKFMTPEFKARFGASSFVEGINMYKGQIYTLPATGVSIRLVYNRDIFKRVGIAAPPKTLDEMVTDARLITSKLKSEGIYGFALPMSGNNGVGRGFMFSPTLSGVGVNNGFDYAKGQYDFSVYKPYLSAYKQLFSSDIIFPGTETLSIDPMRAQFANGRIGMYSTFSHSEYGVYTTQFPTKVDWAYAELPTLDGTLKGTQPLASAGVFYEMSASSKEPEKAFKVLQFLTGDEFLSGYQTAGLGFVMVPSATKIAKPSVALQQQPFMALNDNDKMWPAPPANVIPQGVNYTDTFGQIFFGKIKDADIDSTLADLSKRYNDAYAKAIEDGKTTKIQYPGFTSANPVAK